MDSIFILTHWGSLLLWEAFTTAVVSFVEERISFVGASLSATPRYHPNDKSVPVNLAGGASTSIQPNRSAAVRKSISSLPEPARLRVTQPPVNIVGTRQRPLPSSNPRRRVASCVIRVSGRSSCRLVDVLQSDEGAAGGHTHLGAQLLVDDEDTRRRSHPSVAVPVARQRRTLTFWGRTPHSALRCQLGPPSAFIRHRGCVPSPAGSL